MTDEHLHTKIHEAIDATGGDRHDAHKLLMTWAIRDPALLLEMAHPHLKAIATGLIDHAVRARTEQPRKEVKGPEGARTAIDDVVASVSAKARTDKRKNTNIPPPKETERQASAMRKLAEAFEKKK